MKQGKPMKHLDIFIKKTFKPKLRGQTKLTDYEVEELCHVNSK